MYFQCCWSTTCDQLVATKDKLSPLKVSRILWIWLQWCLHHYLALHHPQSEGGVLFWLVSKNFQQKKERCVGAKNRRCSWCELKRWQKDKSFLCSLFLFRPFFPFIPLFLSFLHPSISSSTLNPSFLSLFILFKPSLPFLFPPPLVPTEHMGPARLLLSRISPPC